MLISSYTCRIIRFINFHITVVFIIAASNEAILKSRRLKIPKKWKWRQKTTVGNEEYFCSIIHVTWLFYLGHSWVVCGIRACGSVIDLQINISAIYNVQHAVSYIYIVAPCIALSVALHTVCHLHVLKCIWKQYITLGDKQHSQILKMIPACSGIRPYTLKHSLQQILD